MAPYAGQYRTINDLFSEALAKLGVLSSGQPVDPEDYNYILAAYDGILRKLDGLDIVHLSSYDVSAIPGNWFIDLASIIAGECASKFGYTGPELYAKMNEGLGGGVNPDGSVTDVGMGSAAKSLKAMGRLKPTFEPLIVEYI
jgi:hypothetical protein